MSALLGCLLEPATGFTGLFTTMVLSGGFACASASDSQLSSVCWSNVPGSRAVVDSTALAGHGGGCMTCLTAASLAASFHILPIIVFSNRRLANSLMTSVMHSKVRPASLLSQWRTAMSSSVPSFHLGHAVGALNHIHPSFLFGSLYWFSVSISYVPGALNVSHNLILKAWAIPFGVTFWYHSQKPTSSRFNVCQLEDTFINQVCIMLVILSRYLMVSWTGQVRKHKLVLSHASEHTILLCALQGCIWSPSLPWLLVGHPWIQDFQGNTCIATCSCQLMSFWVA